MSELLALADVRRQRPAEAVSRWPGINELGQMACMSCARETLRAFWPGPIEDRPRMRDPEDLMGVLAPLLVGRDRAHAVLLSLDTRHRLIDIGQISIGDARATKMGPREIYRDALLSGATAIAVAHNHPSGEAEPSLADITVTKQLAWAGKMIGISMLDHLVVVSATEWTSLRRNSPWCRCRSSTGGQPKLVLSTNSLLGLFDNFRPFSLGSDSLQLVGYES